MKGAFSATKEVFSATCFTKTEPMLGLSSTHRLSAPALSKVLYLPDDAIVKFDVETGLSMMID
jgi:hypothetical protein